MEENTKKKKLILIPAKIKPDQYLSLHALIKSLESSGEKIEIAVDTTIPAKFTSALSLGEAKIINKLPEQKFLLQFPGQKSNIKNIQWNQTNESMNIYINMENGKFIADNMNFSSFGGDYSEIYAIGLNSLQEAGSFIKPDHAHIFANKTIVSIGTNLKVEGAKIITKKDDKSSSIAEDLYIFLKERGKVTKETATSILAGIFYATKNFKENVKDPQTFINCAELVKAGTTNKNAQDLKEKLSQPQESVKPQQKPNEGSDKQGQ